jgi:hypothetical protein
LSPALGLLAGGVRHGVRFVEKDNAIKAFAEPVENLLEARILAFALAGAQRRVSGEKNAPASRMGVPRPKGLYILSGSARHDGVRQHLRPQGRRLLPRCKV